MYTDSGSLLSCCANQSDLLRRTAAYADKIFKGAKPGNLASEQSTKFEMILNLKSEKALNIKIPDMVLV